MSRLGETEVSLSCQAMTNPVEEYNVREGDTL